MSKLAGNLALNNSEPKKSMDLINSLREELQHNDIAQKLLDILEEELD